MKLVGVLLSVSLIFLLLGCTSGPSTPVNNSTNQTNATTQQAHSSADITKYLQKHLVVYYGLWNVEIPEPSYSSGKWTTDVKVFTDDGDFALLRTVVDDNNFSVDEMWQKVFLNKEPAGIADIEGKLGCSGEKVKVMEFANPYCQNCVALEKPVALFRGKFNNSVDYEYRVMLPKTNTMIETYGYDNVSLTAKYYICTQKQGLLDDFRKCVMGQYAKQTGEPLDASQLDSCAIGSKANTTELKVCVASADKLLAEDMSIGQTYLGNSVQLPSFTVDCRFKTSNPNLIRYAICYEFPKTEGC